MTNSIFYQLAATIQNVITIQTQMVDIFNYCFDVPTTAGLFPAGTTGVVALPALEAALSRCLSNEAAVKALVPTGYSKLVAWTGIKNSLYLMRDTARDYGGTIEGSYVP